MKRITLLLLPLSLFLAASDGARAQSFNAEPIKDVLVPPSRMALFVDMSAFDCHQATTALDAEESVPLESLLDFGKLKTTQFKETHYVQIPFRQEGDAVTALFRDGEELSDPAQASGIRKFYVQTLQEGRQSDYIATIISDKEYASDYPDFDFLDRPDFTGVILFSNLKGKLIDTRTYYGGQIIKARTLLPGEEPSQGESVVFVDLFSAGFDGEAAPAGEFRIADGRNASLKLQREMNRAVKEAGSYLPVLMFREQGKPLVGEKFLDVQLPDQKGKRHFLSEYLGKGRWVLVDFWASWCGPCRRDMPSITAVYKKYHDRGFEIVGLSLDAERNDWKEAIRDWDMPWVHLSDLKHWGSKAAQVYDIHAIPDNILVDPEGKVVARGIRGYHLEFWLENIYQ